MTPRATAGWVAAVSGGLLAIGLVAASVAAAAGWIGVRAVVPGLAAPGMMGPAMMGGGAVLRVSEIPRRQVHPVTKPYWITSSALVREAPQASTAPRGYPRAGARARAEAP